MPSDMLPDRPLNVRRKKVALVTGAIASCGIGSIAVIFDHPPNAGALFGLACIFAANAGIVYYSWPATDGLLVPVRGSRKRRKGTRSGLGLDTASGRTSRPPTVCAHPALGAIARLMPETARRRWLAEAESLLFEMPTRQRRKALRSYLLSAPRLLVLLWTRELSRHARRMR